MKREAIVALGFAAVLLETTLWHWPLGAGERLAGKIEAAARSELRHQEMNAINVRIEQSPLRRRLVLAGPADDFQQRELARILDEIPGVSGARWTTPPRPSDAVK